MPEILPVTAQATAYWTPTLADLPNIPRVAQRYWDSFTDPQRGWAIQAIEALPPVASVLDLGCQAGANLRALRTRWPALRLAGLDVNAPALDAARAFMAAEGWTDITLHEGVLPAALDAWPDDAVDVVLSTYCLAYVSNLDLVACLTAALRVARIAVIVIEPMVAPGESSRVCTTDGSSYVEWRHDFIRGFAEAAETLHAHLQVAIVTKPPVDRLTGVVLALKAPHGQV